ncbi:hypothetical protein HDC30_002476 [Pseudomonas sp. JAI115]|uniref:hypothetical protein n=1 Tax=Pseudomonas sp. JAI115 TaxID=2723061 RepID=UPI001618030C|nr:hypothetical protein [Pseudomonas sp. JAI115]MBB6155253.1 hypothetical protein [Pseudomonas sp. JAI115]
MIEPTTHMPMATPDLPRAVYIQVGQLLQLIRAARTHAETQRAMDRAQGFVLGLETTQALPPDSLGVLHQGFDTAVQKRRQELEHRHSLPT